MVQPESIAAPAELQQSDRGQQEAPRSSAPEETTQEGERAARRRSTVREKVSFLAEPSAAIPVENSESEPPTSPAPSQPVPEPTSQAQPRRAGWWSRRFGGGE
jgi:ribonuclease E